MFTFSGGCHWRNLALIHTDQVEIWMGFLWTEGNAFGKVLKKSGRTSVKTCIQKGRGEPLHSQMTIDLNVSLTKTGRSFTTGGYHPAMMYAMKNGSFPQWEMEDLMEIGEEKGLERNSRILNTGVGRLRSSQGKGCHRHRGLIQTRGIRGWVGRERSRSGIGGGSQTSVPVWGLTTKELEEMGKEGGDSLKVLIEADKGKTHIMRGASLLKDNEEKWMTSIILGKF